MMVVFVSRFDNCIFLRPTTHFLSFPMIRIMVMHSSNFCLVDVFCRFFFLSFLFLNMVVVAVMMAD